MTSLSKFHKRPSHDTIPYIITSRLVATLCGCKSRVFHLELSTYRFESKGQEYVFHVPLVLLSRRTPSTTGPAFLISPFVPFECAANESAPRCATCVGGLVCKFRPGLNLIPHPPHHLPRCAERSVIFFCFLRPPFSRYTDGRCTDDDRLSDVDLCSSYSAIRTRTRCLLPFRPTTTSSPPMPGGYTSITPHRVLDVHRGASRQQPQPLRITPQSALDMAPVLLPLCSRPSLSEHTSVTTTPSTSACTNAPQGTRTPPSRPFGLPARSFDLQSPQSVASSVPSQANSIS